MCDESTYLLTSVDLPVVSQVTRASQEKPIVGMMLKLEMAAVREILSQEEFPVRTSPEPLAGWPWGRRSLSFWARARG